MTGFSLNWRYGFLPAVALLASCSQEPPKELCAQLNSTIDRNIVAIAVFYSEGASVHPQVAGSSPDRGVRI
jgi:hypothetical protein